MTRLVAWGVVLVILLGAAVLTSRKSSPALDHPSAVAARDPQLARCQALGEASGEDAQCRAAWALARKRFFGGAAS